MKNVQSITFDQIIKYANKNSHTNFSDFEHYHRILGKEISELFTTNFEDTTLIFDSNEEILIKSISEWVNKNTPKFHSDLIQWFTKNFTAIDEYIEAFNYPPDTDIIQIIRASYSWTLEMAITDVLHYIQEEIIYDLGQDSL